MAESINERHGRKLETKRELVEIAASSLLAAATLEVGTIDVITYPLERTNDETGEVTVVQQPIARLA